MKKKFFAFLLTAISALSLFSLCACGGKGNDGGNPPPPDSTPANPFECIEGKWSVDEITIISSQEVPEQYETPENEYILQIGPDGSFTLYVISASRSYAGTVKEGSAAAYFTFSCTMGENTVTANAYYNAQAENITFDNILFEGTLPAYNYSTCICVPSDYLI